jgi:Rrf2 family nitric oxide-sensitive transcriptional repressor
MKLTTQTDYALRTLMFLASKSTSTDSSRTDSSRTKVADIASLFGISVNHVAKVVNSLSRYEYIRSTRGVGGGIELAKQPQEISVGEVIEKIEGDLHLLACVGDDNTCAIHSFCRLRGVLAEAERVQKEYLNNVTLADIAPDRQQLAQLL